MNGLTKALTAEFIGTFALIFIGAGAGTVLGGPVNQLGATLVDTQRITYGAAFALEAVGTFFLVNTVLNTAVRGAAGRLAPFAIGMTVTICILMFGALTGGSVNPARTIGPAVAAHAFDGIAVYLVAQLLG